MKSLRKGRPSPLFEGEGVEGFGPLDHHVKNGAKWAQETLDPLKPLVHWTVTNTKSWYKIEGINRGYKELFIHQ